MGDKIARGRSRAVELSMRDVLNALTAMETQITILTQSFTPLVNSFVGQLTRIPMTISLFGEEQVKETVGVAEIDPKPVRTAKKVDYLSVLEHIYRVVTTHFKGSTDPIKADEWRS